METDQLSLAEIMKRLRTGSLHPRDVRERCEAAHDPALGAYRVRPEELAARACDAAAAALACGAEPGPLCGIPVSVKDIYGVTGLDTFAGTPQALPEPWCLDGPLVAALRAQLAVIAGKTHTVEFAFGGLGTNVHWPTPVNPHRPEERRVPGGSSSGAGVSVREGSALLALGTDTAGSVRVPASMTGVAGFKPGRGVWSTRGIVPLSPSLDTPGILARDAEDLAFSYAALVDGSPPEAPPPESVALAVPRDMVWADCDAGIVEAVEGALARLRAAGARCVAVDMPELSEAFDMLRGASLAAPELDHFLATRLPQWRDTLDPNVAARLDTAAELSAREYLERCRRRADLVAAAPERLEAGWLLVSPTVAITPPRQVEVAEPRAYAERNILALRNTAPANLFDFCAVTLPCGEDSAGMPVGLQLMARRGGEPGLLAAARTVARILRN